MSRFQGSAGKRPPVVLSYWVLPIPDWKEAALETFPGPTSPLTEVQQLSLWTAGMGQAREMLDLAGGSGCRRCASRSVPPSSWCPPSRAGAGAGLWGEGWPGTAEGWPVRAVEKRWGHGLVRPGLGWGSGSEGASAVESQAHMKARQSLQVAFVTSLCPVTSPRLLRFYLFPCTGLSTSRPLHPPQEGGVTGRRSFLNLGLRQLAQSKELWVLPRSRGLAPGGCQVGGDSRKPERIARRYGAQDQTLGTGPRRAWLVASSDLSLFTAGDGCLNVTHSLARNYFQTPHWRHYRSLLRAALQ